MNETQEKELHKRMSRTVRLGLCIWQDLQSPETYNNIADRLIKDIKFILSGKYINI